MFIPEILCEQTKVMDGKLFILSISATRLTLILKCQWKMLVALPT